MRHALISIGVLGALMLPATPTVAQTREGKKLQLEQFFDIESVSNPRISPDGTQIVYTRGWVDKVNDRRSSGLWIMNADGTKPRSLTNGSNAIWSPDGTRIAFNSDREGIPQVYVMNADGTALRRLSDVWGEYPAWSPDGDRIAFESYMGGTTEFGDPNYDVFVMDADGSGVANLTDDTASDDGYPTWSPDGEWIAFDSDRATPEDFVPPEYDRERTGDSDIWVMRPDGSDLRNVTASLETLEQFPDWSRQGIVCTREGAIVVVSSDGSTELDVSKQTGIYGQFPAWVA